MWDASAIEFTLVETVHPIALVEVRTPLGTLTLLGSVSVVRRSARLAGVHIQGLMPGALGRIGLNRIGERMLVELDVDEIVIEGSIRTTGTRPGIKPRAIRFPHPGSASNDRRNR